jgi:signal transduction histidine kinase
MDNREMGQVRSLDIAPVVAAGLRANALSDFPSILQAAAESLRADGCSFWTLSPGSDVELGSGYLLLLGHWLSGLPVIPFHDLPFGSVAGEAIRTQQVVIISDVSADSRVHRRSWLLDLAKVKTLCATPVALSDGSKAALTVYRRAPVSFDSTDESHLKTVVSLVALLYHAVSDRVGIKLVQAISSLLQPDNPPSLTPKSLHAELSNLLRRVCDLLAGTLECVDASITLEDEPGVTRLVAATRPPGRGRKPSIARPSAKEPIAWVLEHSKSLRIPDIAAFDRDHEMIDRIYPGVTVPPDEGLNSEVRSRLGLAPSDTLPAVSLVAVPILDQDTPVGAVACAGRTAAPFSFAHRDVVLLNLVATQIAQYFQNWLRIRFSGTESRAWEDLATSISQMNTFVHSELARPHPDERRIYAEVLRVSESVLPEADIMSVSLYDESTNELYFAQTHGKAWHEGDERTIATRLGQRFPLADDPPSSASALVFQTGQVYFRNDLRDAPNYAGLFPQTRRIIIAPIGVANQRFGVLAIRSTRLPPFPRYAEPIAELLGQQLGLYRQLASTIQRLRSAETQLTSAIATQRKTFEDLGHQLKSPIVSAGSWASATLRYDITDRGLAYRLSAVRGLCRKARRVAGSLQLFAALAAEKPVPIKLKPLSNDYLVKMLFEAAADNETLVEPERSIRFWLDADSFGMPSHLSIQVDNDLLEQAVNSILDNAGKYSYSRTTVRIYGGITSGGRFHISVSNKGIRVRPEEIKYCTEREWRSEAAQATTGEGTGIGLWIVHHIMAAHHGDLVIVPTTTDGITDVKLVFPVRDDRRHR